MQGSHDKTVPARFWFGVGRNRSVRCAVGRVQAWGGLYREIPPGLMAISSDGLPTVQYPQSKPGESRLWRQTTQSNESRTRTSPFAGRHFVGDVELWKDPPHEQKNEINRWLRYFRSRCCPDARGCSECGVGRSYRDDWCWLDCCRCRKLRRGLASTHVRQGD